MPARNAGMKWIWRDILLNINIENHRLQMKITKHFYLQGMGGWNESETISCQTQLIMHYLDSWEKYKRWFKLQYLNKKLLKKLYLQEMWGCSKSEGISYQTPIPKKLLRNSKMKKILSENLKVWGIKAKNKSESSHLTDLKWK